MADFAKHLPLSQRPSQDESGVGADWHREIARTVTAIADLLESLDPESWDVASLAPDRTVREMAGYLVWRLGSSNRALLAGRTRTLAGRLPGVDRAAPSAGRTATRVLPADIVGRLREIAAEKDEGRGRHSIRELSAAVSHGIDIAVPLGVTLPLSPVASGAVALRQALIAPRDVRGVLRSRTLLATDAGWRVGRGRILPGTAEAHLLFLFGRRD